MNVLHRVGVRAAASSFSFLGVQINTDLCSNFINPCVIVYIVIVEVRAELSNTHPEDEGVKQQQRLQTEDHRFGFHPPGSHHPSDSNWAPSSSSCVFVPAEEDF